MDDSMKPERIAFRSTKGEGRFAKSRWTEIAAYYLHQPPYGGHAYVVETKGCSSIEGEQDRTTRYTGATLQLALARLDDGRGLSGPARSVIEQAQAWAERNARPIAPPTYSEAQREAAVQALRDANWPVHPDMIDVVAAALGLTREASRG